MRRVFGVVEMIVSVTMSAAPWYKHRWPWILMAGPAVVIVASFVTFFLAVKSNDGLVAEDYYKQGLTINRVLGREDIARKLGISAELHFSAEELVVHLKSSVDLPGAIRVTLAHPTRAGQDQSVLLRGVGGRYQGRVSGLAAGRWLVTVSDEGGLWRIGSEARLPDQQKIVIVPSELAKN